MNKENTFVFIWRGWSVAIIAIFLPIFILFIIFAPEERAEIWPAIFMVPIVAALQGLIIATGVILGNKIWFLTRGAK